MSAQWPGRAPRLNWRASPQVAQQLGFRLPPEPPEVTDAQYVSAVRRFRRSELLTLIAATAPDYSFNTADFSKDSRVTPWGLADIARISLVFGTDFQRRSPTFQDLVNLLQLHNDLNYPGLKEHEPGAVANMFLQLAFSQFPFQRHIGPMAGRTLAILDQTQPADPGRIQVLRGDWQNELLGCTLAEYIGVTQLLTVAAKPNNGQFDPAWVEAGLRRDVIAEVFNPVITRQVLRDHMTADINSFRTRDPERPSIDRRFSFNPLIETPVVSGVGPNLLMPVPDYINWKTTPLGLYFTGVRRWGDKFSQDLGELFQAYVGRQLQLIEGVQVHPEIPYQEGRSRRASVDWIVVFPDLVLLAEVKSARPTQALRSGAKGAAQALQRAFDKANRQLETTRDLIMAQRPEFSHIPSDRPVAGIVVTIEDFHVANSALHLPMYSPSTIMPTLAVSSDELEGIVVLGAQTTEAFLHEQLLRPPGEFANLRMALSQHAPVENPILAAGIDASPIARIKDVVDDGTTQ